MQPDSLTRPRRVLALSTFLRLSLPLKFKRHMTQARRSLFTMATHRSANMFLCRISRLHCPHSSKSLTPINSSCARATKRGARLNFRCYAAGSILTSFRQALSQRPLTLTSFFIRRSRLGWKTRHKTAVTRTPTSSTTMASFPSRRKTWPRSCRCSRSPR